MQNREKLLAIGFGLAIVVWFGGGVVSEWVLGPFRERNQRRAELTEKVEGLTDQALEIARNRKLMSDWKLASLPPDRGAATAKRPDALDAQRLYQAWLTDLVNLSGFDRASVKPAVQRRFGTAGRGTTAKTVYVGVVVTIESEGRFSQICSFFDHFYRARLLQRINKLNIESRESQGDPILKFSLEAEGLALVDVPWRATLFPETQLVGELSDRLTRCEVTDATGFPQKVPFRVRMGSEYLLVTAVEGTTWTLERGADRTFAARHPAKTTVELAPVRPDVPSRSAEEFREILAANVFIKPPPPKVYDLRVGPLASQTLTRGQSLSYTIPVSNYDPTLGKPEFVLTSTPPDGLQFDRGLGKVTWNPGKDVPAGNYSLPIEVRHPNASGGMKTAKLDIVLREPNTPPRATPVTRQTVVLGRPWTLPLKFEDAETSSDRLQLKLESPPAGLVLNTDKRTLEWTPPDATPLGEMTLKVTATDTGTPPQSFTLSIPVDVRDDSARFTFLVASVLVDGEWQAWLYNRAVGERTILRMGDDFAVDEIRGKVVEIGKDFILLQSGETLQRLNLGRNLREMTNETAAVEVAPAKS